MRLYGAVLLLLAPVSAYAQPVRPNVAILVYEGVQVIDHAVPYEVFGQFALNNVYIVAETRDPVTTFMGMRIVPHYSFADAPAPDVLVLPGGDTREAQRNPAISAWVTRAVAEADHVLTVCTGIFFLVGNEILDGRRVTTWYGRQGDLRRLAPRADVVSDMEVVESGRLVSSAGLGVDAALRILARLHGPAWAEVVRLNMEHEPIPEQLRVPRAHLADQALPGGIYSAFPWREADLRRYEGGREEWLMDWRFDSAVPLDSLRSRFLDTLSAEEGWTMLSEEMTATEWTSRWSIDQGSDPDWRAVIRLHDLGTQVDLEMRVARQRVHSNP
jgi:putative intracellular protease/amidase